MTPNWFAAVMGTGIVSVVAASLPPSVTGAATVSIVFAVLATLLLAALTAALATKWVNDPERAAADARGPAMFPFYGAVAMAFLTVGSAVHHHAPAAVTVALWSIGTALGLTTYVVMVGRLRSGYPTLPSTVWLMPLVPPMVSATGGAGIAEHVPSGAPHAAVLTASYALFVLALAGAVPTLVVVGRHLLRTGLPDIPATPTLWIPLGVVGQSVAAANLLGTASGSALLHNFGIVYGYLVGTIGIAALLGVAAATLRGLARGLTFNPTWWSFTFPLGACALGANSLGVTTGSTVLSDVAAGMLCALIAIWAVVSLGSVGFALNIRERRLLSSAAA